MAEGSVGNQDRAPRCCQRPPTGIHSMHPSPMVEGQLRTRVLLGAVRGKFQGEHVTHLKREELLRGAGVCVSALPNLDSVQTKGQPRGEAWNQPCGEDVPHLPDITEVQRTRWAFPRPHRHRERHPRPSSTECCWGGKTCFPSLLPGPPSPSQKC